MPLPTNADRNAQGRAMTVYFSAWCVHDDLIQLGITSNVDLARIPGQQSFTTLCKRAPTQFLRDKLVNFQSVYALREREVHSI